jgi:hypothetical protein
VIAHTISFYILLTFSLMFASQTQYNDVVPQLPRHQVDAWDYYYPEFWIEFDNGTVTDTDIKIVNGFNTRLRAMKVKDRVLSGLGT